MRGGSRSRRQAGSDELVRAVSSRATAWKGSCASIVAENYRPPADSEADPCIVGEATKARPGCRTGGNPSSSWRVSHPAGVSARRFKPFRTRRRPHGCVHLRVRRGACGRTTWGTRSGGRPQPPLPACWCIDRPSRRVGSVGDTYDNATAETTIGVFKNKLIRRQGPWRGVEHVEIAAAE